MYYRDKNTTSSTSSTEANRSLTNDQSTRLQPAKQGRLNIDIETQFTYLQNEINDLKEEVEKLKRNRINDLRVLFSEINDLKKHLLKANAPISKTKTQSFKQ